MTTGCIRRMRASSVETAKTPGGADNGDEYEDAAADIGKYRCCKIQILRLAAVRAREERFKTDQRA